MILKNCRVMVEDLNNISFPIKDIRITDGYIEEILDRAAPEENEIVLDMGFDFAIPGMVNSHYHSYTNILRGTSDGEPLEIWSSDTIALGSNLDERTAELSTYLGICEMLKCGVTSCLDHLPHIKTVDAVAGAYKKTKFRAVLAPMLHNIRDEDALIGIENYSPNLRAGFPSTYEFVDFYREFIKMYHKPEEGLRVAVGINSPQRIDDELLEAAANIAHENDLGIHSHVLESKWQRISSNNEISPVQRLDRYGLLSRKTSLAHGIWVNHQELDLMAEKGITLVSNPTSNAFLGSGTLPFNEYISRGIPIALGSDGLNCGTNHNMLEILKVALLLNRITEDDYNKWVTTQKGYHMISVNGSEMLGFKNLLGVIVPGSYADIVIVDKRLFIDILEESIPNQLVFNTSGPIAKHVLSRGDFVMKDGKVLVIDEEDINKEIESLKTQLKHSFSDSLEKSSPRKALFKEAYKRLNFDKTKQ